MKSHYEWFSRVAWEGVEIARGTGKQLLPKGSCTQIVILADNMYKIFEVDKNCMWK